MSKIVEYSSTQHGKRDDMTLVVAWGEIHSKPYTYARLYPKSECRPGYIPFAFIDAASAAFERALDAADA